MKPLRRDGHMLMCKFADRFVAKSKQASLDRSFGARIVQPAVYVAVKRLLTQEIPDDEEELTLQWDKTVIVRDGQFVVRAAVYDNFQSIVATRPGMPPYLILVSKTIEPCQPNAVVEVRRCATHRYRHRNLIAYKINAVNWQAYTYELSFGGKQLLSVTDPKGKTFRTLEVSHSVKNGRTSLLGFTPYNTAV